MKSLISCPSPHAVGIYRNAVTGPRLRYGDAIETRIKVTGYRDRSFYLLALKMLSLLATLCVLVYNEASELVHLILSRRNPPTHRKIHKLLLFLLDTTCT